MRPNRRTYIGATAEGDVNGEQSFLTLDHLGELFESCELHLLPRLGTRNHNFNVHFVGRMDMARECSIKNRSQQPWTAEQLAIPRPAGRSDQAAPGGERRAEPSLIAKATS